MTGRSPASPGGASPGGAPRPARRGGTPPVGRFPIPEGARRVLLFGGTFDPPHVGHAALPARVAKQVQADWVLYIPAGRSPLKKKEPRASDYDRLGMLRVALTGIPNVAISTVEIGDAALKEPSPFAPRPAVKPNYTIDTVRSLRSGMGASTTLRLLIGADQAASFHLWRDPRDIIELAPPVVILRPPYRKKADLERELREATTPAGEPFWTEREIAAWLDRVVAAPLVNLSATRLRTLLEVGGPDAPQLATALPPGVLAWIRERRLYV